jgi:hypothetical protein
MSELRRPSPTELNQMISADKEALLMRLFDLVDVKEKHLEEAEKHAAKKAAMPVSHPHRMA